MVARRLALLVARFVFFVDDDRAEIGERREDGGSRTDGDALLAATECEPCVVPLAVAQRAVQDGDAIAECGAEAIDRLWREGDLRDEHDRALIALVADGSEQLDGD